MFTMYPILVQGNRVKVYISQDMHRAYVFPPFGRYYALNSDANVLDLATTFLLSKNNNNVISFAAYQSQDEDTAVIHIDKVAA